MQLKTLFKNLKGRARMQLAEENAEHFATGGGPYRQTRLTNPFTALVQSSVTPLRNEFDSSSEILDRHTNEEEESAHEDSDVIDVDANVEVSILD